MQVWYMRTIRAAYHAKNFILLFFWLFCPLASQCCLHQLSGALHIIHLTRCNRRSVPCRCFALYAFIIRRTPEKSIENIAQKSAADFMQIDGMNILIYIVYNSWTTTMPLRGRRSPVAPFYDQDVILYAWSFYSVIHILYSLIIHCFNGKELYYALIKLEYTRIVLIFV